MSDNERFAKSAIRFTGNEDDVRIDIEQEREVTYWAHEFNVTTGSLRRAVSAMGPIVKDVKRWLFY